MTKMFHEAKKAGVTNEAKMWSSVEALAPAMLILEEEHPVEYWDMMRNQHEILWGPHYNEDFANHDVAKLKWKGKDGMTRQGAHWSKEQVEEATKSMQFPAGTTPCDKYVAFNSFYAAMCDEMDDTQILKGAYAFFFKDKDEDGKVWRYMRSMNKK